MSESDLTLKKAFEIAVGMETAERESNEFRNEVPTPTNKVTVVTECYRCGKSGHYADDYYYKNSKYHKCKDIGHLSRKCKKKAYSSTSYKEEKKIGKKKCNPNKFKAKPSKVHQVEEEYSESSENEQEWSVFTVKTPDNRDIKININIESVDYTMELDTGASLSLISEDSYQKYFSHLQLENSNMKLTTYTGDNMAVLGELHVKVRHGKQTETLPLIVVKGRNWLSKLTLDWHHIRPCFSVKDKVNKLMKMDAFNEAACSSVCTP